MSGARSYRGIITFLEERRDLLNQHFGMALKRAPAVNTLRTVLQSLDAEALEQAFRHHARDLLSVVEADGKPMIALDGKTLRGSFDHLNDKKAAQTLTAFASSSAILLAHMPIAEKSNEIPAAQPMIGELGLTGVIFTADAMHCQKNV
jgi:DDE_Tnp_1-associated